MEGQAGLPLLLLPGLLLPGFGKLPLSPAGEDSFEALRLSGLMCLLSRPRLTILRNGIAAR